MITFARVDVGIGGLPVCPECGDAPPLRMRPTAHVIADVRRVGESWHEGPGPNVCLAGGDAFAHPELPALVSETLRQCVERLRLTTAGPALSQGVNALGVIDAGVRHIEVVVVNLSGGTGAGAHVASLDSVLGGLGAFIEAARSRGVRVAPVARVKTCAHTFAAAPATVAALAAAGAVAITVELSEAAPFADDAWANAVIDSGVVNRAWVQFVISPDDRAIQGLSPLPGVDAEKARAWNEVETLV